MQSMNTPELRKGALSSKFSLTSRQHSKWGWKRIGKIAEKEEIRRSLSPQQFSGASGADRAPEAR